MRKSAQPPHLTVVEPGLSGSQPSRLLGAHGQALWRKTTTEYRIEDAAGVEMLTQACQALDRAEGLADRIAEDARFDGLYVLRTNSKLPVLSVALAYRQLWKVEAIFRTAKSILETRPIHHQSDTAIAGHLFCSFLALLLRKELDERLAAASVTASVDSLFV